MLLKAAIGDAYGSGYEFAPEYVFEYNTLKTYLVHADASGFFNRYTDDTQMAMALTELIVSRQEWTPLNIANKFVEVFKRDVRVGYAGRFFEFLKTIQSGAEFLEKIIPTSERNGASMRAFPIGVYRTEKDILAKAEMQARLTHNTDEGVYSAQLVALSTHYFLYQKGSKHEIEAYLKKHISVDWDFAWSGKVSIRGRDAVLAALAAIRKYDKLSDILKAAIDYQGDVDTVATLAMAMGSVCAEIEDDLPKFLYDELENGTYGREFIESLNDKLMDVFIKNKNQQNANPAVAALLGVAVADAVGVPYEFSPRERMESNPAKREMIGFGRYNVPAGTWSDDSSLTFCLAESLVEKGYDLVDLAKRFIAWKNQAHWTATGVVFDIGITTSRAISELQRTVNQTNALQQLQMLKYLGDEYDNGNGSLMRILPLLFYIKGKPIAEQFEIIKDVAALTHRHIRGAMCCLIYLRLAEHLLGGEEKVAAYQKVRKEIQRFWNEMDFSANEAKLFIRIIERDVRDIPKAEIKSGGYVMESIEAALWCFLHQDNYVDTVLTAINLGHDTDTTAAIVGGLAGLYYGVEGIPQDWLETLKRREDIEELGKRLNDL
ncbi:MAG: ADP-ribosylglycohydrolase family protein [Saprospiraceae bacterium]